MTWGETGRRESTPQNEQPPNPHGTWGLRFDHLIEARLAGLVGRPGRKGGGVQLPFAASVALYSSDFSTACCHFVYHSGGAGSPAMASMPLNRKS